MLYVIRGLNHNYSSLVITISYKRREIRLDELLSMMRTHKNQSERMNMPHAYLIQANLAKSQMTMCGQQPPQLHTFGPHPYTHP